MNKKIEVLNAQLSQDITLLAGDFKYADKKPDGTPNKLAGQSYWRCRYEGTVFTTNDARFVDALKAGTLAQVKLLKSEEKSVDGEGNESTINRLEIDSFRTMEQAVSAAAFNRKMRILEETPASATELQAFGFEITPATVA